MFDQSFIPDATSEFVVLADTHYMLDAESVEFDSRRQQTDRIARALQLVKALGPEFVVHLGDVVQEFPESDDFERAVAEANRQLETLDCPVHHVAGNHDVGDKPDPTMPTRPVSKTSLDAYHDRYGRSWYSWDHDGVHFVVINTQLLNSSLSAATDQREWLETDLQTKGDAPTILFCHLPPFLHRPDEPAAGHYDNIGQPARDWLIGLFREYAIDRVCTAHTHFSIRNRIGDTLIETVPSPAFTRPGFGELFVSCPPPERGRDDRPKLGLYLFRMRDGDIHAHHIRTDGETGPVSSMGGDRFLTRSTSCVPSSPLGVSLLHPITEATQVPATFPSAIRQEVHNDYPLQGCLEMGVTHIRTPIRDVDNALQRRKLTEIRRNGGTVVGTVLVDDGNNSIPDELPADTVDEVEIRITGEPSLSADVRTLRAVARQTGASVSLSTVVPERTVAGKQHDRLRGALSADDVERIDDQLDEDASHVERVLRWVGTDQDPWEEIGSQPASDDLSHIDATDWLVPTTGTDMRSAVDRASRALFAAALQDNSRVYLEPLREMDRTMDPAPGLLDRRCNPTPVFHAVRCQNTVLFGDDREWHRGARSTVDGIDVLELTSSDHDVQLALPPTGFAPAALDLLDDGAAVGQQATISLMSARRQPTTMESDSTMVTEDGPTLSIANTSDP